MTEAANAGSDTVAAFVNYTLPASNTVEVLNMIGAGLTGTGTDGAETFISSSGPNTLIGLGGNDIYYVNNTADVVIEAPERRRRHRACERRLHDAGRRRGALHDGLRVDRHGHEQCRHVCSAAADPTPWSGSAAMISIT